MSNLATKSDLSPSIVEKVLVAGDLSKLTSAERLSYYARVCESIGLNPLTRPFEYITLNNRLTLYARRDATDQIRNVHKVSLTITSREMIGDVYVVTAKAKTGDGREDESTGAVFTSGLKGESLANAMMKAETKAKRRVTLSICGLGLLDETEVESIPETTQAQAAAQIETRDVTAVDSAEDYVPQFGKFKGQRLGDLDVPDLANYLAWLETGFQESGNTPNPRVSEFITKAHELVAERQEKFERGNAS